MAVSQKYQKELPRIKKNVEKSRKWFHRNYESFNAFTNFIFKTTISSEEAQLNYELQKPNIEANILEAFISRLCGEFAKSEPSIVVSAQDGKQVEPEVLDFYEGHIRYILSQAKLDGCEYNIYRESLSAGFSNFKISTDYANPMSFEQIIKLEKTYNSCMTGYDPMAVLPSKSDGNYSFECFPYTEEDFKHKFPNVPIEDVKYTRNIDGFSWSYSNNTDNIIIVCDYYEKKKKKLKIVKLSDNNTMTLDEYKKNLFNFQQMGIMAEPPQIVEERTTDIEVICRYRFIENQVIEYIETDYKYLPLIFVDGNSVLITETDGKVSQLTRSYIYNAKGTQRLKNFALQTLANGLENMVQSKWLIAKESIPLGDAYLKAYTQPQLPSVVVYNAFNNNNPEQPVPPPREVQALPIPPEVLQTVQLTDNLMQTILGSFDQNLSNINSNQISSLAIIELASLNNSAAMPYVVNYIHSLNQVAQIIVDLIPKYNATPKSMPIIDKEGHHKFVLINQEGGVNLNHEENAINVKVEAGVSFGVQKSRALQQIIALMQTSQLFAQFMNTEGLPILLDNIEMRGADQLKALATDWMQKMKDAEAKAQEAAQQNQQPDPMMMQMQMMQQQQQIDAMKAQTAQADLELKNKKIDIDAEMKAQQITTERLKVLGQLEQEAMKNDIELKKSDSEELYKSIDMALRTEKEMLEAARSHQE